MFNQHLKLGFSLSAVALAIIGLALMGNGVLGFRYLQSQREQNVLASEIAAGRKSLSEYGDAASRQERLATAEAEVAVERAAFPRQLSSSGTVGALIQLAEQHALEVMDVKTQPGSEQQLGDHTYHSLSVHVQVEGAVTALRNFIKEVESGALRAASVDELRITIINRPPASGAESLPNGPGTAGVQQFLTVSLDFSVYARTN